MARKARPKIDSHAKLHLQMDVRRCTPRGLQITGKGNSNEQTVLGQNLEPQTIYLIDRGYCGFDLLNRILAIDSHFVLRMKLASRAVSHSNCGSRGNVIA
ncbi:MAG: transposase [Tepidisphaeraceae bacterium]